MSNKGRQVTDCCARTGAAQCHCYFITQFIIIGLLKVYSAPPLIAIKQKKKEEKNVLSVSLLWQTWQSPRLGCCRCSLVGSAWRRPDQRAAACSPALSHPQTEASWKCTDLWGPVPAAARVEGDRKEEMHWMRLHHVRIKWNQHSQRLCCAFSPLTNECMTKKLFSLHETCLGADQLKCG